VETEELGVKPPLELPKQIMNKQKIENNKNCWLFEWSDKTNQDEKLTLVVMGSNLAQVQICDQRSFCDSKPDS
jgi:hypothetical protein